MSFDATQIGPDPVARVVVASTQGSVPREVGAAMMVSDQGVTGTIGGGALEFEAIDRARGVLSTGRERLDRVPLGPGLGQCCGGAVTLLTEVWTSDRLATFGDVIARPLPGQSRDAPLSVKRILTEARNSGQLPAPAMVDGWMIEPVSHPHREIWVWGAGHVGRALVDVLAPLPMLKVNWADKDHARFPEAVPDAVKTLIAENPADLVSLAGPLAEHFVLTYSHALDLEICHRVLKQPFGTLGLIGSATKRARFRSRLAALGLTATQIDRMECPIGDPALGKHPQAIALGVASRILRRSDQASKSADIAQI
ncbi:MAG: xanthine dehydrogenase accessory protein XdhC [Paracoccaceae bacterium]|nr:xanthine dehydrogenase accessory protein XdhC [Paracoccaceae bacterium]